MGMFLAPLLSDNKAITFIRGHIFFSNFTKLKKTNAGGAKLKENEVYESISAKKLAPAKIGTFLKL